MKNYLLIGLCSILFGSIAAANPTLEELGNVRLVHLTNILANHTVVPGATMALDDTPQSEAEFAESVADIPFHFVRGGGKMRIIDVNGLTARRRITTHWSVYQPIDNLMASELAPGELGNWDNAQIAVIELAKHFYGQLHGGYWEDISVVGPHELSEDAIIVVPKSMLQKLRQLNPKFKDKNWITYDPARFRNARLAVERINAKRLESAGGDPFAMSRPKHAYQQTLPELIESSKRVFDAETDNFDVLEVQASMISLLGAKPSSAHPSAFRDKEIKLRAIVHFLQTHPDVGQLYFGGKYWPAKDIFEAWRKEGLYWGFHDKSELGQLEAITGRLFASRNKATLMQYFFDDVHGKGKTPKKVVQQASQFTVTKGQYIADSKALRAQLEVVAKTISRLSQPTRAFFEAHQKDMSARIAELKSFGDF